MLIPYYQLVSGTIAICFASHCKNPLGKDHSKCLLVELPFLPYVIGNRLGQNSDYARFRLVWRFYCIQLAILVTCITDLCCYLGIVYRIYTRLFPDVRGNRLAENEQ